MRRKRLFGLAVLALISLIATGSISDRATRVMAGAVAALDHTRGVLLHLGRFRGALAKAEADARGFAITAAPVLLSDFEDAAATTQASAHALKRIASSNARERTLVTTLDTLVDRQLELLRELITLKQRHEPESAMDANVMQGTTAATTINRIVGDVKAEEVRRFEQQTAYARSARRFALYGPWAMCVIAVVIFASMLALVISTFRAQQTMRDDLRAAVASQNAALQRAQEADQMKDQFLAAVSHDLRTPLTAIMGWCGMLQTDRSPELLDEGLATIEHAARMQSQLIEDLLDVSRAVAGRLRLCVSDVNVADVVDKAIASVTLPAQEKGIAIRTIIEKDLPPLAGDPARIEQVVWNLLSNSVKFTPEGGAIEVWLRSTASQVEITVRDDGEGITPDLLPHIFDRFRQGTSSTARKSGLGLGLSIVKNIVELHGGSVHAESEGAGKGATFTVRLPLQSMSVARPELTRDPPLQAASTAV